MDIGVNGRWERDRGAVAVETALSALVFLSALIMTIDLIRLSYYYATTQFLAARILRVVNVTDGAPSFREAAIIREKNQSAGAYGMAPGQVGVTVATVGATTSCPLGTICKSDPRDLVSVKVSYRYKFFYNVFEFTVESFAVGRNEPFSG